MKISDIPHKYICKEKGDDCRCSSEQQKICPSAKKIVDEDKLKKIIMKKNKTFIYNSLPRGW